MEVLVTEAWVVMGHRGSGYRGLWVLEKREAELFPGGCNLVTLFYPYPPDTTKGHWLL